MDKYPTISVIVPVYHVEKELKRCLDSLLRQTFSDYEIILINDGGTEKETAICEEYAAEHARIKYHYQNHQGVSVARNVGLSMARGGWLMFVDSDDWVSEDFCQKAIAAVKKSQVQMAIFDFVYANSSDKEYRVNRSPLKEGVYPMELILKERLAGNIASELCTKIYKKELWDGILFPAGEIFEDAAVLHEVIDRADRIAILHDVLYYYNNERGRGSITEVAYRTGDCYRWLYIQRRKRYLFIKKKHPDMLDIVNREMSSTALRYAVSLVNNDKGLCVLQDVSKWLNSQNIQLNKGSFKARSAFFLLLRFPCAFYYVIKTLLFSGFIKERN